MTQYLAYYLYVFRNKWFPRTDALQLSESQSSLIVGVWCNHDQYKTNGLVSMIYARDTFPTT